MDKRVVRLVQTLSQYVVAVAQEVVPGDVLVNIDASSVNITTTHTSATSAWRNQVGALGGCVRIVLLGLRCKSAVAFAGAAGASHCHGRGGGLRGPCCSQK